MKDLSRTLQRCQFESLAHLDFRLTVCYARELLLWWTQRLSNEGDCMVSRENSQARILKPAWARLRQYSLVGVG